MMKVAVLQGMILPLVMVCFTVFMQTSMLFFRAPWAVYVGLACLMLNRPSCLAVGNPFVRERYEREEGIKGGGGKLRKGREIEEGKIR